MKKIIMIILVGLGFIDYCFAGNRPGAVTLTLADAYYHFSSAWGLKNASMPNFSLAYNIDKHWAVEGSAGVLNTNQRTSGVGEHGFLYTLDGLYRLAPHKHFEPYFIAGLGVLGIRPQINNNSEHEGNVNAGIGTQFFADRSIALRAEFRDIYTLSGGKNDWMLNAGVSLLLGG